MAYVVVNYTTNAAVPLNGTITLAYPPGFDFNSFQINVAHSAYIAGLGILVSSAPSYLPNQSGLETLTNPGFSLLDNGTGLTITWLNATTIPAGSAIVFQFNNVDTSVALLPQYPNPDGTSTIFNCVVLPGLSLVNSPYCFRALIDPLSTSSAIFPVLWGDAEYLAGASLINGGGHMIGVLGRVYNANTTNALPECIGIEGRIDNSTGTITSAICADLDLSSNAGTITFWTGAYADIAGNAGTVTTAAFYTCQIDGNAGSIGTLSGFYIPTFNSPGTVSGTFYGYLFNNNPGIAGTKYAVYCGDANASITTLGPIVSAGSTTTGSFHLDTGTKTVTATGTASGTATLNKNAGVVTMPALSISTIYILTLTNSTIAAADVVLTSVANITNTATPLIAYVTPSAGQVVIGIYPLGAAFNGTISVSFAVIKN